MLHVLVVDDSAVVRAAYTKGLASDGDIKVVEGVGDPIEAHRCLQKWTPDVIVLDAEMPKIGGLAFL